MIQFQATGLNRNEAAGVPQDGFCGYKHIRSNRCRKKIYDKNAIRIKSGQAREHDVQVGQVVFIKRNQNIGFFIMRISRFPLLMPFSLQYNEYNKRQYNQKDLAPHRYPKHRG